MSDNVKREIATLAANVYFGASRKQLGIATPWYILRGFSR
jgi:hypothetical protein